MPASDSTRLTTLERQVRSLKEQVDALILELQAMGIDVPEYEPNPGRKPMSPQALRVLRKQLAAKARAAKQVGSGKGKVSKSVKTKLAKEARGKKR